MSENTKLWDILARTDPAATKPFKRGGGFSGTAIKPIWSFKRMTEEFGPCGKGWGVNTPDFQLVNAGEEILVFCTVSVWYANLEDTEIKGCVVGVGGDKVLGKNKFGLSTDDEAFKKAFTDATTNALKMIGVGADVHMGQFEDNKYVQEMQAEFAEPPAKRVVLPPQNEPEQPGRASSASLKRDSSWSQFAPELAEVKTFVQLAKFKSDWRAVADKENWNQKFRETARDLLEGKKAELSKPVEDDDVFPGDLPSTNGNTYADNYRAG